MQSVSDAVELVPACLDDLLRFLDQFVLFMLLLLFVFVPFFEVLTQQICKSLQVEVHNMLQVVFDVVCQMTVGIFGLSQQFSLEYLLS